MSARFDWERLEPGWRAGIKSVLQLAADYEAETGKAISHTAINKHFRKLGVPRDLKAKVMAKAEAMVSAAEVSGKVSVETTATDAKIVDANALTIATVQLSQRKDVSRSRALVMKLLAELEFSVENADMADQLAEVLSDKDVDKASALLSRASTLGGKASTMKTLSDALKTLITLERESFGMDDRSKIPDAVPTVFNMRF